MRWRGERQSDQVEDRRGMTPARGGMAIGGGAALLVLLFALFTGQDPRQLLDVLGGAQAGVDPSASGAAPTGAPADEGGQFAATVLASTEDAWTEIFRSQGQSYRAPTLVLFSDAVASACGTASSAVGPFYCPADQKVYLDLSFYELLSQRFGAPGDFAQAYVVAHEVGHHVQQLLGIADQVTAAQQRASEEQANGLSVRMELQADCLAGVWGNHANRTRQLLEPGDVEEGLRAAAAIGDDMMQRQSAGRVRPESWTHGSSEMRVRWLRQGLSTGDPDQCDTFKAERL
ncbi:MAG: neutral zinc metallopeptidase [Thermoanaerobaculia bacterium]|nr:neutral zinc metallopeptidase [Thermoanaerobaculia bacterium]